MQLIFFHFTKTIIFGTVMKRLLILTVLSLLMGRTLGAEQYEYGLRFNTYPSPSSEFTGLLLENGEAVELNGRVFRMEFDIYNRPDNILGSVFRLITGSGDNIDLMYTVDRQDHHYPILVTGEYVHDILTEIPLEKWIHVTVSIEPSTGLIILDYGGSSISVKDAGAKGADGLRISFGYCMIPDYSLSDVPSFNLRDVYIYRDDILRRHWDLSIHNGDVCLDNEKDMPAVAVNPKWMVDQYISWREVFSADYPEQPSVAYDPSGAFYITVDGSEITGLDLSGGDVFRYRVDAGGFPSNAPNQLIFDGSLIAYNLDECISAFWDKSSSAWKGGEKGSSDHYYYNKASVLRETDSSVVSFGGYGHYHYNNNLLVQYPYDHSRDVFRNISEITPRYGCSVALMNDSLFVFGGRGNLSGKQGLSPKSYCDLYAIDLKTFSTVCLWSDMPSRSEFIMAENMVFDPDENCFYAFASYGGGKLIKFARESAGYEEVSLPAGLTGNSQYLNLNIYLDRDSRRLYLSMITSNVDGSSRLEIKCMDWPPVTMQLLHQSLLKTYGVKAGPSSFFKWFTPLLVLLLSGIYYLYRRKVKGGGPNIMAFSVPEVKYYDFSRNSVRFLGGFRVFNKFGEDITCQFTPNLKALLILLILNSTEKSVGISGGKINRILWSYKSEDAANNNRNVYISKLRSIFDTLEGFKLVNENRLFSIRMTSGALCDWSEVKKLLNAGNSAENLLRLMELLSLGSMLPDCEVEWLDSFKGDFSNNTIDILTSSLRNDGIPDEIKLRIANVIFTHDFLNEEALKVKCGILYQEGKTSIAKSVYEHFCREYSSAIGEDYTVDFKKVISR